MAKWKGKVGYITHAEVEPGVWIPVPVEKPYKGDILRSSSSWATSNKTNDDLKMSGQISIVANPFAYEHFSEIKYVEFMGGFWEVSGAEPNRPRIILTVGGVYNGQRPESTQ